MTTQPFPAAITATFNLSEPELTVVCATLDTDWLPGMSLDEDLMDDEARYQPILATGVRTLAERGILFEAKLEDKEVTRLDEAVQATVLACAQPEHAVSIISQSATGGLRQAFFYRVPELVVLHKPLDEAQHQFELGAAESAGIGLTEIERALSALPDASPASTNRYSVPQDALAAATDLSRTNLSAAAKQLAEVGMAEDDASALARTLSGLTQRILIQFQNAVDEDSPDDLAAQTVLTFLSDGERVWLLESDDPDPEAFTVQATTRADALALVSKAFAPMM